MQSTEAVKFSNISATTAAFPLMGGKYQVEVVATFNAGSVGLQMLGPDGTTWLPSHTALLANGVVNADAPPGQYRVGITTATAVFASVARIPVRV